MKRKTKARVTATGFDTATLALTPAQLQERLLLRTRSRVLDPNERARSSRDACRRPARREW